VVAGAAVCECERKPDEHADEKEGGEYQEAGWSVSVAVERAHAA
jgi:hypothetical protein